MANKNTDAKAKEPVAADERGSVVHKTFADEEFKPKGAIAFFVVLVLLCAVIWFSIYYIQLARQ
jgi:hypothetical protein